MGQQSRSGIIPRYETNHWGRPVNRLRSLEAKARPKAGLFLLAVTIRYPKYLDTALGCIDLGCNSLYQGDIATPARGTFQSQKISTPMSLPVSCPICKTATRLAT